MRCSQLLATPPRFTAVLSLGQVNLALFVEHIRRHVIAFYDHPMHGNTVHGHIKTEIQVCDEGSAPLVTENSIRGSHAGGILVFRYVLVSGLAELAGWAMLIAAEALPTDGQPFPPCDAEQLAATCGAALAPCSAVSAPDATLSSPLPFFTLRRPLRRGRGPWPGLKLPGLLRDAPPKRSKQ